MDSSIRKYLSGIGKKGGEKSRRALTPEQARKMVKVREARRAFKRYRTSCFWSYNPEMIITEKDILWVADQLMRYGDREAWYAGKRLCH